VLFSLIAYLFNIGRSCPKVGGNWCDAAPQDRLSQLRGHGKLAFLCSVPGSRFANRLTWRKGGLPGCQQVPKRRDPVELLQQGEMEPGLTVGPGFREMIEKALARLNEPSVGMRNCPHR
jgi:hypothetical protein